jgi:hypothetical protein
MGKREDKRQKDKGKRTMRVTLRYVILFTFAFCLCPFALAPSAFSQTSSLSVLHSQYYTIHTDLDSEFAEELATRMDAMYQEYSRRLVDFGSETAKSKVYLFEKKSDYLDFVGQENSNTGGMFMPSRNVLASYLEGQGRSALRCTLQHEAFHQFAFNSISPDLPIWLNEGIAVLFEEGIWNGERFWLGQVSPRRLRQLHADMSARKLTDFKTFLSLSNAEWSARLAASADDGTTQYTQAWAMVHFLAFAQADGKPVYRSHLLQFLRLVHEGVEPAAAFQIAFANNVQGFQDRFVAFARNLKPTREATLLEHQEILSMLLRTLNAEGRTYATIDAFRDDVIDSGVYLEYTNNRVKWRTDRDARIYFRDLEGRALTSQQLYFSPDRSAPLPDLVRRHAFPHPVPQIR